MSFIHSETYIFIFITFLKFSVSTQVGVCNECFASNNVTCVDETHFSICHNGLPTATITTCPGNRVCTDHLLVCRSINEGFTPICYHDYCGDCDVSNGVFTCLDQTTYGYCFGGKTPNEEAIRSCPVGYVCNYNSPDICVPAERNQPSCLSETTTITTTVTTEISTTITTDATSDIISTTDLTTVKTTADISTPTATTTVPSESTTENNEIIPQLPFDTTAAPRTPNAICGEVGKLGYFKSDDRTCREFVYCYPLSGEFLGRFYYCDGYFNAETQKCQNERPSDCISYSI